MSTLREAIRDGSPSYKLLLLMALFFAAAALLAASAVASGISVPGRSDAETTIRVLEVLAG